MSNPEKILLSVTILWLGFGLVIIGSYTHVFAITFSAHGVTLSENMTKAKEELKALCGPIKVGITPPTEAMINNATYADMMNYLDTCTTDIVENNYHYSK